MATLSIRCLHDVVGTHVRIDRSSMAALGIKEGGVEDARGCCNTDRQTAIRSPYILLLSPTDRPTNVRPQMARLVA